jgi:hypothetical protein
VPEFPGFCVSPLYMLSSVVSWFFSAGSFSQASLIITRTVLRLYPNVLLVSHSGWLHARGVDLICASCNFPVNSTPTDYLKGGVRWVAGWLFALLWSRDNSTECY